MTDRGMELVDLIDAHVPRLLAEGVYHCTEDGEPWPCLIVEVAHHAFGLGHSAGTIDAARYAFPIGAPERLVTMVMASPLSEPAPFSPLDPTEETG